MSAVRQRNAGQKPAAEPHDDTSEGTEVRFLRPVWKGTVGNPIPFFEFPKPV